MTYGLCYYGSKSRIADKILAVLPPGRRFVDVFGGGGAMTHAAILSGKYEKVLYRDAEPMISGLIRDIAAGRVQGLEHPEWISREAFFARRKTDAIACYVWSYICRGETYLMGTRLESVKREIFDWIVEETPVAALPTLGKMAPWLDDIVPPSVRGWRARRLFWRAVCTQRGKGTGAGAELFGDENTKQIHSLERLERIAVMAEDARAWLVDESKTRMQCLENLSRLADFSDSLRPFAGRLEVVTGDYTGYSPEPGDVIYCDPPYKARRSDYVSGAFDTEKFLDWAAGIPCYVSEYSDLGERDARFRVFSSFDLRVGCNWRCNSRHVDEILYTTPALRDRESGPGLYALMGVP